MSRKKVLFFNRSFHPDVEATGQLLRELTGNLSEQFDITIIAGRSYFRPESTSFLPFIWERHGRVKVLRVHNTVLPKSNLLYRVINLTTYFILSFAGGFFAGRQDIIIALTDPPVIGLIGSFFSFIYGAKFVYYCQDIYPDVGVISGRLTNRYIVWLLEAVSGLIMKRASLIVVLGEDMKKRLLMKGAAPEKTTIIPNWADPEQIYPIKEGNNPLSDKFSLGKNRFIVMFVGNLGLTQDLENIIIAASRVTGNKDILFIFVGDGAKKQELVDAAKSVENVLFIPYQPKEEIKYYLSLANVHIVSLHKGLWGCIVPSKVYGIMASRRPFIAAIDEESDVAQMIREHECGILAKPGDADDLTNKILWAYDNRSLLNDMGRRGREALLVWYSKNIASRKFACTLEKLISD